MRDLIFTVKNQILAQDVNCNFDNIVAGTENYLKAVFKFSKDWEGFGKVAVFTNVLQEQSAVIIRNGECVIPKEALIGNKFSFMIRGLKNGEKLITNSLVVKQNGGN